MPRSLARPGWRAPLRALALATAVTLPAVGAADALAAAPPTGPLAPQRGVLLGAFTAATQVPAVYTGPHLRESLRWLESAAGRKLDVYHYYYRFGMRFPTGRERELGTRAGRIPMVSWAGTSVARINSGAEDATIRARADDVRRFRSPIFLRWFWEMDGSARRSTARTPAEYIAAWRRIVTTFRSRGASNAVFVWCPNAWAFDHGDGARWYPGDDYVDWICADGYNWSPARRGAAWQEFQGVFKSWYAWAAQRKKPLMVGETGAMERGPGERAAWIDRIGPALRAMPAIRALLYFDTWDARGYDWRLRTSADAAAAWQRLALDPTLRAVRPSARDTAAPRLQIAAATRGWIPASAKGVRGTLIDPAPSAGVLRIEVGVRRGIAGACADAVDGRWRAVACDAPTVWYPAAAVDGWRRAIPQPGKGRLTIAARVTDGVGHVTVKRRTVDVRA